MITKVFYHANCNDGFGAAWVAQEFYGKDAEYIPFFHGSKEIEKKFEEADWIYFLDMAPRREVLLGLLDEGKRVTVIDHHKTAKERLGDIIHPRFEFKFDTLFSAAVLTWFHFFGSVEIPWLLRYVQDIDLWTKELPFTEEVSAAIRSYPFKFDRWSLWGHSEKYGYNDLIDIGATVLRTEQNLYRRMFDHVIWKTFGGVNIPFINSHVSMSEATNELLIRLNVPVAGYYFDRGDMRQYGLRGNGTMDVSDIAKQYGGGGHHDAAGFQLKVECIEERNDGL